MDQSGELPSGYKEVRQSEKDITLSRKDLPWLATPEVNVHMAKVTLDDGTNFYLGSAIKNKTLAEEAEFLGKHGERSQQGANRVFYAEIKRLLQTGRNPDIIKLFQPKGTDPIFYVRAPHERVYFLKGENIDGNPAIIRIAACIKSRESKVLNILSNMVVRPH